MIRYQTYNGETVDFSKYFEGKGIYISGNRM